MVADGQKEHADQRRREEGGHGEAFRRRSGGGVDGLGALLQQAILGLAHVPDDGAQRIEPTDAASCPLACRNPFPAPVVDHLARRREPRIDLRLEAIQSPLLLGVVGEERAETAQLLGDVVLRRIVSREVRFVAADDEAARGRLRCLEGRQQL